MPNITHKISLSCPIKKAFQALSTLKGLNSWWTTDTTGSPEPAGTLQFRFNGQGPDMKVLNANSNRVEWKIVSGPEEWINTHIIFDLKVEGDLVGLYFQHAGWAEESPFHFHCSMKWATFLLSLKLFLETGQGRPFPNDIPIESMMDSRLEAK